jgi:hypothetical protein
MTGAVLAILAGVTIDPSHVVQPTLAGIAVIPVLGGCAR